MRPPDERERNLTVQGRWSAMLGNLCSAHGERGAELHASHHPTGTMH